LSLQALALCAWQTIGVSTLEAVAIQNGEDGLRGAGRNARRCVLRALRNGAPLVAPRGAKANMRCCETAGDALHATGPNVIVSAGACAACDAARSGSLCARPEYLRAPHPTLPA
jgi:hypothetical protein